MLQLGNEAARRLNQGKQQTSPHSETSLAGSFGMSITAQRLADGRFASISLTNRLGSQAFSPRCYVTIQVEGGDYQAKSKSIDAEEPQQLS
jgi:hypothetical protein